MNGFDPRLTSFSFRPIQFFCPFIPFIVVFGYAVRLLKTKKKNKNKNKQKTKNKTKQRIFVPLMLIEGADMGASFKLHSLTS